jgi:hypothetical protein
MPAATSKPNAGSAIKHSLANVFQISCGCKRVLHVRLGRAECAICQMAYAVRVDSWSIRAEDPAPPAEEPTISAKEGLT